MNTDTLETVNGPNGSEVDGCGNEDLEETWRQMREVVDETLPERVSDHNENGRDRVG